MSAFARLQPPLDVDRTGNGVNNAGELSQNPIAGRLENPTHVFGDLWIDQLGPQRPQRSQRAHLVMAHEPAVTDHIGSEYGGQTALHGALDHARTPPTWDGSALEPNQLHNTSALCQGNRALGYDASHRQAIRSYDTYGRNDSFGSWP
ncbi:hypothetical protein X759_32575 [Mesorhizobium sp. LSHC420B00]|uniref:hypothetical protein n=1 Tax=unclassified Mesorhizobium TaxID=325217 RepID=UPI0003CF9777|nr:hypothetical protein [Mesorhizobium sp. LSHC420B00]ESX63972.1 hypothetical protein X759_32575 [Mesorhizobium sp. LSHC420B00]